MALLADSPATHNDQSAYQGPGDADPGPATVPGLVLPAGRSEVVRDRAQTIRSWPLLLLAFPAATSGPLNGWACLRAGC
jgi:hypothetical protein